jgi:hypothetical protein
LRLIVITFFPGVGPYFINDSFAPTAFLAVLNADPINPPSSWHYVEPIVKRLLSLDDVVVERLG